MPAWWGRKSHKNTKEVKAAATPTPEREQQQQQQQQHRDYIKTSFVNNIDNNNYNNNKSKEKFDQVSPVLTARNSVRTGKDFGVSCGSDSDGHCGGLVLEKKGHPLPRPSVSSSSPLSLVIDHGLGSGSRSGSVSVSSVSSSGSSEEASPVIGSFGNSSDPRAHVENKLNLRSRSPGPGSRGLTAPTSPLHPRQFCTSLDSSTGKQEDGKTSCHPLPLPPGSPTNRCTSPTVRSDGANESTHCLHSKWKKGKLLGRGTFGHVYVGFNSENGQMCAIKEVKVISDDQTSKECLKQLNQEIQLLSQLSHPNIVQYYGSELGEDTLSVYLEYVSGGSIHKLLQEYGPFKEPVIQSYTRQILYGLAYLHGRNTVHRDIKGANILVGPNGEVKLVDFGMAKHITSSSVLSFKGSPYWMAPEVIMNIGGYSLAVDIWSLGCTIFEMATSKPPWSQYEGVPAIFKIGNSKDIPEIPDHLSSDAKSFLRLCLQRDPSARPTAAQLMDHPFIRDQAASRVSMINLTNDAPRSSFKGNHTQTNLEFHPNKTSISIPQRDYVATQLASSSRAFKSTSGSVRVNLSLPVSPCSSPLRNYGPAYKSCLLSPPHPTYTCVGQGGYDASPVLTTRAMTGYAVESFEDLLHPRTLTPSGSPRLRPN